MQTKNPKVLICDSHVHLFSRQFFKSLASQNTEHSLEQMIEQLGWDLPSESNIELGARWVKELDKHGVHKAVLIASVPGDESSVADAVGAFSNRFWGYFMLNPLAYDAVERAEHALDQLGLRGICLFPAMHHFSVQDSRLRPIYELASQREGVVVFVHMGVLTMGIRSKFNLPSKFNMSYSNPIDLHQVALEFPRANFVVPHFGAGYFREVLMLGDLTSNVYLDTSSSNSWIKYQVPAVSLETILKQTLEVYGSKRLLFGSDSSFFPRGWNASILDTQVGIFERLGTKAEDIAAIFGENLGRLLGE